ncbi:MAG: hypothetical protein MHMPM18_003842 [Marteilia pararefringens]
MTSSKNKTDSRPNTPVRMYGVVENVKLPGVKGIVEDLKDFEFDLYESLESFELVCLVFYPSDL